MKSRLTPIKEPYKSIVNEEYQRAKRILKPLLKGKNRSFITIKWDERMRSSGGVCWKGSKTIYLNHKYRDVAKGKWSEENFRMTLRHEIVHLVELGHTARFKSLLRELGGHRFVGRPKYTGSGVSNK